MVMDIVIVKFLVVAIAIVHVSRVQGLNAGTAPIFLHVASATKTLIMQHVTHLVEQTVHAMVDLGAPTRMIQMGMVIMSYFVAIFVKLFFVILEQSVLKHQHHF
jgi:hypothetical protein